MLASLLQEINAEGLPVGSITVEITLPEPARLKGAGYKILKTLTIRGCGDSPWRMEEARLTSLAPLLDGKGRPLLYYEPGWKKSLNKTPEYRVRGPLTLTASWAGKGQRFVNRLVSCISKAAEIRVTSMSMEILQEQPATTGTIRLQTPAQFKFSARASGGVVLPYPSAWRWVRLGVDTILGREDQEVYALLARHLEIVEGSLRRVTIYLDEDKPTNWALRGWVRVEATGRAPDKVLNLLGWGLRLAGYLGVGKSRLEGLGRALVERIV